MVFLRENMVVFTGKWSVKPIPYEKSIFGNDQTFALFISEN
jgi:hypothetical protein